MQHERHVAYRHMLVSARNAYGGGVVSELVLRLDVRGVLGSVAWERELFGERLIPDARAKAWVADGTVLFEGALLR